MDRERYERKDPVLLPFYPRIVFLALRKRGYAEEQLLGNLGFSQQDLEDEAFRLTLAQHEAFILRAIEQTGNPHLALELMGEVDTSATNLSLLAIANSGKISRALHAVTRYNRIFTRVHSIRSFEAEGQPVMELESHLEHDSVIFFAVTSFALFLDQFFLQVLDGEHLVQLLELELPGPAGLQSPPSSYPFELRFNCARTRIHFAGEYLDQPMKQADPTTVRLITEMTERQLVEAEAEMSVVGAVRALLVDQVGAPPKLDDAARMLGLSSRSLRRKLAEAGTTYQRLLDSVRLKLALKLLRDSTAPVASIAYELGFNNPSDFTRAFKKWNGEPPSAIRRNK